MPHFGTLRDVGVGGDIDDIRGTTVYGLEDEKIGKIDDVIVDHDTGEVRYAVVDSGGWLKSHKFLVPADRIAPRGDKKDDEFVVPVTKQQIEAFPPYDESLLKSEGDWATFDADYKTNWHDGPVQHQHGSDRNITPAGPIAGSGPGSTGGSEREISAADVTPQRIVDKFNDPTPTGQRITLRPAGTAARAEDASAGTQSLAPRWSNFRDRVRNDWANTRKRCGRCEGVGPEIERNVA